ncbi:MAG: hypothetical protein AUI50_06820 [Crenarchaeota archaeon 13_1_40CM_2_52_14]|nr:MAG: hypothetical protein AUI97_09510 [Crenarchaeota archaeon 13_1_40CM_3_52_17]OLD34362.1 MAG: hypothetical protein AUI50_06820 [Crenarchaeota archaeon 13_1_40CM_2_52_14]
MSNIAYLAGVLKGDGYLYRGQTGRPRFQVETMSANFAEKIAGALRAMGYVPRIARYRHSRKSMRLQLNVHRLIREWNRSLGNVRNVFHHFIWRI